MTAVIKVLRPSCGRRKFCNSALIKVLGFVNRLQRSDRYQSRVCRVRDTMGTKQRAGLMRKLHPEPTLLSIPRVARERETNESNTQRERNSISHF